MKRSKQIFASLNVDYMYDHTSGNDEANVDVGFEFEMPIFEDNENVNEAPNIDDNKSANDDDDADAKHDDADNVQSVDDAQPHDVNDDDVAQDETAISIQG